MLVYFADLAHDYFTAYSKNKLGDKVDFRLFKSVNKFLDAYENE